METKVYFKVYQLFTRINSEAEVGKFDNEEDAINFAKLSKKNQPKYGYKVVRTTEESIFSTEVEGSEAI